MDDHGSFRGRDRRHPLVPGNEGVTARGRGWRAVSKPPDSSRGASTRGSGARDLARELEGDARPEEQRPMTGFVGQREPVENSLGERDDDVERQPLARPQRDAGVVATLVKYVPPGAAETGTYSPLMSRAAPPFTARVVVCAFTKVLPGPGSSPPSAGRRRRRI